MKSENSRLVAELPTELYKQVKIKAIQADLSLTEYVQKLVIADLEKDKKKSTC